MRARHQNPPLGGLWNSGWHRNPTGIPTQPFSKEFTMLLFWSCTLDSEPVLFSRDLSSRCLGAPCPGRPWRNAALCGVARNRLLVVGSRVVRGWQVWRVGSTLQSCEGGCFHCFSLLIFIISFLLLIFLSCCDVWGSRRTPRRGSLPLALLPTSRLVGLTQSALGAITGRHRSPGLLSPAGSQVTLLEASVIL